MKTNYFVKKARVPLLLMLLFLNLIVNASTLPNGFAEVRLLTGLNPTAIEVVPDGRLFIVTKNGQVLVYKNNALLATPLLSINVDTTNERGMHGITLDPNFAANGFFYVYYTVPGVNYNRISRFTANGDVAAPSTERILIETDAMRGTLHNGGALFFKAGKLFITTGDGADRNKAQSFTSLLGKVLRINPDGTIPADNPFVSTTTGVYQAIYALGFRNPFKATVQRTTGRIFVNDVGELTWEEVNDIVAGKNYGWPTVEGRRTTQVVPANYMDPVFTYQHSSSNGCAITGGAFYNPVTSQFPSQYAGKYFFQDYCTNSIRVLDLATFTVQETFATGLNRPIDIEVASDGSLYYVTRGNHQGNEVTNDGEVWKVIYTGRGEPTIGAQPVNTSVASGGRTSFSIGASGNGPLLYQWQKNNVNIPGATSAIYTINTASMSDNGAVYRVVVSNTLGTVTSNGAVLTVINSSVPVPNIISPTITRYNAGQVINFSATATDPEDGELPASAFTWEVRLYHDEHFHPALGPTTGSRSGSYTVPTFGETSSNVWYRVLLTVRDSDGQSTQVFRDIFPNRVQITLTTNPPGFNVKLDGTTYTTPYQFIGVVGIVREIEAVTPQAYQFSGWSDSGASRHEITTPSVNTIYTATYTAVLRDPENPANTPGGVDYSYYEGTWSALPDFNSITAIKTGNTTHFNLSPRNRNERFAFKFTGYITIPADGVYTFYTRSDDGSKLFIGNTEVVNNDGLHGSQERSGIIGLKAGKHAITVTFFDNTYSELLEVSYSGPNLSKTLVPASALSRLRDPENPASTLSGVEYSYYEGTWSALPDFNSITAVETGNTTHFNLAPRNRNERFAFKFTGYITIPTNGVYTFYTRSDDGSKLFIGNTEVVNNDGLHGSQERSGVIGLKAGKHAITVTFFENTYGELLEVSYSGPNLSKTLVPASVLSRINPVATNNKLVLNTEANTPDATTVTVYPNPVFDVAHINKKDVKNIVVYNSQGAIVLKSKNNAADIDMSGLPAGIYTLEIQTQNKNYIKKVIKK